MLIEDLLNTGEEKAISKDNIMKALNIETERDFYRELETERKAGAVICSSSKGGFYLPKTADEVSRFLHKMEARAKTTIDVIQSAKDLRERMKAETFGG